VPLGEQPLIQLPHPLGRPLLAELREALVRRVTQRAAAVRVVQQL
jgi:hypothetical protein